CIELPNKKRNHIMNLLNIIKGYLSVDLIQNTAHANNVSEHNISSIFNASIPIILGTLINKSSTDSTSVFAASQDASNAGVLERLTAPSNLETGTHKSFNIWTILQNLFGEQLDPIIASVANYAGVTSSVAKSVFGLS